jgi:rhamnopyranosyl-N-acetylglucosaminyl-diphospho-decaprenol beta-1,3/1,4-galactofuranosyltransferase
VSSSLPRIAAVVVTHNRSRVLAGALAAIAAQTRPADAVYVVDNASSDDTPEYVARAHPAVRYLRLSDNTGSGPGLAVGIRAAHADGFDGFWLMDDDSQAAPDALALLLSIAGEFPTGIGVVGFHGGIVRRGRILHLEGREDLHRCPEISPGTFVVDFVLLDGALVSREMIEAVGVPRADFFMMMGDVEYPYRARRAGLRVLLYERDLMNRDHLGSSGWPAPWRGYYQTRNHLRWALDLRSPALLFGWLVRLVKFVVVAALRAPDRGRRIRYRLQGARDGFRGRMGRTVEPG